MSFFPPEVLTTCILPNQGARRPDSRHFHRHVVEASAQGDVRSGEEVVNVKKTLEPSLQTAGAMQDQPQCPHVCAQPKSVSKGAAARSQAFDQGLGEARTHRPTSQLQEPKPLLLLRGFFFVTRDGLVFGGGREGGTPLFPQREGEAAPGEGLGSK